MADGEFRHTTYYRLLRFYFPDVARKIERHQRKRKLIEALTDLRRGY